MKSALPRIGARASIPRELDGARLLASVLLVFVFLACGLGFAEGQSRYVCPPALAAELERLGFQVFEETKHAPDLGLRDLNGRQSSLSAYKGKIVFLTFWALWCPLCIAEMPSIEKLHHALPQQDFAVVAISREDDAQEVRRFVQQHSLSFPVLLDETGKVSSKYGVRGIPAAFLIDRNGDFLAWLVGPKEWNSGEMVGMLRKVIDQL